MRHPGLPTRLCAEGIPNLWTEVGQCAIQDPSTIDVQFRGIMNALRLFGLLAPVHEVPEADRDHQHQQLAQDAEQPPLARARLLARVLPRHGQPLLEVALGLKID